MSSESGERVSEGEKGISDLGLTQGARGILIQRRETAGRRGMAAPWLSAMDDAPTSTGCLVNREQGDDRGWAGPALWPLGPGAAVAVPLPLFLF